LLKSINKFGKIKTKVSQCTRATYGCLNTLS